ncbi:MAG: hypothetical protein ACE15B_11170 [Bryobacteraceae bacterium]
MFLLAAIQPALPQQYPPLGRADFSPVAPQGFGDRQNGWAWGMAWFKGKLFVGTNRAYHCMEIAAIHRGFPFVPYPPNDRDMECAPDPADLPSQAEIWSWDPQSRLWTRVYQSPNDVPIPGNPGKFAARDTGFRGMFVFTEPDGTQALYVSGLNARWYIGTEAPARILRSVDGVNFEALPQAPNTVLGDVNNNSFRGMAAHNGRLYVVAGNILGQGVVLGSSNPKAGNDAWQVVTPPNLSVFEIASYNGYLYYGTHNDRGFELLKTAVPGPTNPITTVMRMAGDRMDLLGNIDVISMHVFKGRLYVGGNAMNTYRGGELYRVNPDDSWDLLSGHGHMTAQGFKAPLSGMLTGFNWPLNQHIWRMATHDERLYIGTFDMSTVSKSIPILTNILEPHMGFDLVQTSDGVYFTEIDRQGFQDRYNFGVRTFQSTPFGLFLGTANYYYGLQIWLGATPAQTAPAAPTRLDLEAQSARNLLSWDYPAVPMRFRIYRSQAFSVDAAQMLQDLNLPTALDGFYGVLNQIVPAVLSSAANGLLPFNPQGGYALVGTTDKTSFTDPIPVSNAVYRYIVKAEDAMGNVSAASNFVHAPSYTSVVTFRTMYDTILRLNMRRKFASLAAYNYVKGALDQGRAALPGTVSPALSTLCENLRANRWNNQPILDTFSAEDLEISASRLLKRARLVAAGLVPITAI